jgi:hypothetical protein
MDLDGDADADLADLRILQATFGLILAPRLLGYSNGGCPRGDPGAADDYPFCDDAERVEFRAEGSELRVLHRSATYNCCADDIVITLSADGRVLTLTEEEILAMPCYCMCCYDVRAAVGGLAQGTYTVSLCWYDWESRRERCHTEDVFVPGP